MHCNFCELAASKVVECNCIELGLYARYDYAVFMVLHRWFFAVHGFYGIWRGLNNVKVFPCARCTVSLLASCRYGKCTCFSLYAFEHIVRVRVFHGGTGLDRQTVQPAATAECSVSELVESRRKLYLLKILAIPEGKVGYFLCAGIHRKVLVVLSVRIDVERRVILCVERTILYSILFIVGINFERLEGSTTQERIVYKFGSRHAQCHSLQSEAFGEGSVVYLLCRLRDFERFYTVIVEECFLANRLQSASQLQSCHVVAIQESFVFYGFQ